MDTRTTPPPEVRAGNEQGLVRPRLPRMADYWGLDRCGSRRRCERWADRQARRVMKGCAAP